LLVIEGNVDPSFLAHVRLRISIRVSSEVPIGVLSSSSDNLGSGDDGEEVLHEIEEVEGLSILVLVDIVVSGSVY